MVDSLPYLVGDERWRIRFKKLRRSFFFRCGCSTPLPRDELNLAEAVRQMFGEGGGRQVKDPKNALVTGIGVIPFARNWGTSAALILEA